MRAHAFRALSLVLLVAACAPGGPQRPPELEAAHKRMEQDPNDPKAYLDLARLYFRYKDYLRARQYLSLAERRPGGMESEIFRLGVVLSVRYGQYDEAILRCKNRLEQKEDMEVRLLLSNLYEAVGEWGQAELERKVLSSMRPDDLHQLIEMARFYQRSGRPDDRERAAALYRSYLQKAPSGADAPQARAALLRQDLGQSVLGRTN